MVTSPGIEAIVPLLGAAGALGVGLLWSWRFPLLALVGLAITVLGGQVIRGVLPGQGGGVLLSDAAVCLVLLVAGVSAARQPTAGVASRYGAWWLPWIGWSLATLVCHYASVTRGEWLIGLAYWARTSAYLLLVPASLVLITNRYRWRIMQRVLITTVVTISALGLLQVWLVPNLAVLGGGWDPHEGRLTSTWLDPNFVGGLLAITLPWASVALFSVADTPLRRWRAAAITLLLAAALLLTQSRSSLIAIAVSLLLFSPLLVVHLAQVPRSRRVMLAVSMLSGALMGSLLVVAFVGDRLGGVLLPDATVRLRAEALAAIWSLAATHSGVGVGYNLYQFAAREAGLIADFTVHSRAGADNSLLTLWVTTGIIGVAAYLIPWLAFVRRWLQAWWRQRTLSTLAAAAGIVTWVVHGQFVNSLLYPHLIAVVALMAALTIMDTELTAAERYTR